jgi:hypothetical protein
MVAWSAFTEPDHPAGFVRDHKMRFRSAQVGAKEKLRHGSSSILKEVG